jgi:hypothetical protein
MSKSDASAAIPAAAQTSSGKVTVSSLLAQDYQIAGSVGVPSGGAACSCARIESSISAT